MYTVVSKYKHIDLVRVSDSTIVDIFRKDYAEWIQGLSLRFRKMQIKAATKVNQEMLMFYWSLGKDIVEMKTENKWGSRFLKNLSQDLKDTLPDQNSFSLTNLGYMRRFYLLYSPICPQVEGESDLNRNIKFDFGEVHNG